MNTQLQKLFEIVSHDFGIRRDGKTPENIVLFACPIKKVEEHDSNSYIFVTITDKDYHIFDVRLYIGYVPEMWSSLVCVGRGEGAFKKQKVLEDNIILFINENKPPPPNPCACIVPPSSKHYEYLDDDCLGKHFSYDAKFFVDLIVDNFGDIIDPSIFYWNLGTDRLICNRKEQIKNA